AVEGGVRRRDGAVVRITSHDAVADAEGEGRIGRELGAVDGEEGAGQSLLEDGLLVVERLHTRLEPAEFVVHVPREADHGVLARIDGRGASLDQRFAELYVCDAGGADQALRGL